MSYKPPSICGPPLNLGKPLQCPHPVGPGKFLQSLFFCCCWHDIVEWRSQWRHFSSFKAGIFIVAFADAHRSNADSAPSLLRASIEFQCFIVIDQSVKNLIRQESAFAVMIHHPEPHRLYPPPENLRQMRLGLTASPFVAKEPDCNSQPYTCQHRRRKRYDFIRGQQQKQ